MDRTDAPGPLNRRGPRPLMLHLTLAMARSSGSDDALPNWSNGSPNWNDGALARLGGGPAGAPAGVEAALAHDAALIAGIAAYRRHPWRRDLTDPPTIWREGDSRMLDYGTAAGGIPVLFAPSLVNRAYVLDLAPGHSMLRWLAARGVRPLLLDWGWPGADERRFTLTDYVAGRLERALGAAARLAGGRLVLAGYCMGGTMAVALAQRRPDLVAGLALLAAPWDFQADAPAVAAQATRALAAIEPALAATGALSVDLIQAMFSLSDAAAIAAKYRAFARLPQDGDRAMLFVALEDWLNDGVPLAAPVARETLGGWYGANTPAAGTWRIAGLPVDPGALTMPTLVVAPGRDRIVPPSSARPLASLIPGARLHMPAAGHVGMTAGGGAERALWEPLREWLSEIRI